MNEVDSADDRQEEEQESESEAESVEVLVRTKSVKKTAGAGAGKRNKKVDRAAKTRDPDFESFPDEMDVPEENWDDVYTPVASFKK